MKIERPLDLLNNSKGKDIIVYLKNDKQFSGTLIAFDININVVLESAREVKDNELIKVFGSLFIRGDNITYISPSK
jgi:small nuclear ribonucleoprotein